MPDLLELHGVGMSFAGVPVLRDVSFSLQSGCILGLVGENGAGKSTLMNILGGVLSATTGHMRLLGQVIAPPRPARRPPTASPSSIRNSICFRISALMRTSFARPA